MSNEGSSEKTEEATPRRRSKEREKGHVSKSQDLSAAVMITVGVALLAIFSDFILGRIQIILKHAFNSIADPSNLNPDNIMAILSPYVKITNDILLPFFILLVVTGIIVMRMQVGKVFAPSKIKLDFNNISPNKILKNAKNMLNPAEPRNAVEFAKSILKLLIVFFCGFSAVNSRKGELFALLGQDIGTSFAVLGSVLTQMLTNICLAMLAIGIIDKKYQDYEYNKSIKMSKQEIKDEFKQTEGDPTIKAKIKGIQMKMARQRMFANIKDANVVVTNPTHYAVALKYDRLSMAAPQVVAKGVDFVAFKIREIATENKVPIVENPPLARALYKLVPIDGIIPSDMFVAVAEVLAYVYNKNKKGG